MSFGTKCKNCVFYKPQQKSIKTSCSIGKLEKFEDAVDINEDGHFLKERFCPFHRTEKWASGKDDATLEVFVHAETRLAHEIFIFTDGDSAKVKETLDSLSKIDLLKPKYIRVIANSPIKTFEFIDLINEYNFVWSIDDHKISFSRDESIYASTLKSRGKYITVVDSGFKFDKDFFYKIENFVNGEMKPLHKLQFVEGFCMPKWIFQKEFIENIKIETITKYEDLPD